MMQQLDLFATPARPVIPHMPNDAEARRLQRVDDWQTFYAATQRAEALRGRETLQWGKDRGNRYVVDILQMDDGWHYRSEYDMPNLGGCGPFAREFFPTRDGALTDCLRKQLASIARHLTTSGYSSVNHGSDAQWLDLARWCIEQAPPILFGGADLQTEFEQLRALYAGREKLRCAAIRANAQTYTGEDGLERSIYSL